MSRVVVELLGAFAGVTGSKSRVTYRNKHYLIDCGLFQGPKEVRQLNWQDLPFPARDIDAVILTHAHLDHIGYLPRLYRQGFRGPVYCSEGTRALGEIILLDSAYLEEELAHYAQTTGYSHHEEPEPLFTTRDATAVLQLFQPFCREEWHEIDPGLSFRLLRSGHIIGSSFVQLMTEEGRILTFSGDVGHNRSMTLKGPAQISRTDVLVLESTYGDRRHPQSDGATVLGEHLARAIARGGIVVIPAFAVGRSQELIYMIGHLERKGLIPAVPVILDSPMSQRALKVFFSHEDDQTIRSCFRGDPDNFFPQFFEIIETVDQSMLATMMDGPAIIVSASGMLSGGRVLHHLKRRLPDPRNMVVFSGYQAEGTKGRFLQENAGSLRSLRIHHQEVDIAAEIVTIDHLSSHADYEELLQWLSGFAVKPDRLILNHGNIEAQDQLATFIRQRLGWDVSSAHEQTRWTFFEAPPEMV